ncbi:MAG: class I SAM-dependent methyltransferase [Gemmatimonadaceae bacterium]
MTKLAPARDLALDVATGNGQAAVAMAEDFARVIAIDASENQIAAAKQHPSIEYRVATGEDTGVPSSCVDLVTVAQAVHWLNRDRFYDEARRVMKPGGAICVWCYGDPVIDDPVIHGIVHRYNRGTIESCWRPERDIILDRLETIAFPFAEVEAPAIDLVCHWTLTELSGYLRTWSATAAYAKATGTDPVAEVEVAMKEYWGNADARRKVTWPLFIRAGHS